MPTNTNGGTIVSFTNTPQAQDDNFASALTGLTEDSSAVVYLDVMANDLGGNAKSLWSVDNGVNNSGAMSGYIAGDLLVQDTARIEAMSSDTSLNGARIWITADGKVGYDPSTLSAAFKAHLQALAVGQDATDSFIYAIRLGNGTLSWATAVVHFQGLNDAPVITSGAAAAGGAFNELPNVTGSAAQDQASGTITFQDVDLIDTHTVTQTAATFNWSGGTLNAAQTSALTAASTQLLTKHDSTGTGSGSVDWTTRP
jgi:VCBS repeat-containing protein